MTKLFFQTPTEKLNETIIIIAIIFGITLIIGSIISKKIRQKTKNKMTKKIVRELPLGMLIFGIIDIILIWTRIEQVPIITMGIFWICYLIGITTWFIIKTRKIIKLKKRVKRAKLQRK